MSVNQTPVTEFDWVTPESKLNGSGKALPRTQAHGAGEIDTRCPTRLAWEPDREDVYGPEDDQGVEFIDRMDEWR